MTLHSRIRAIVACVICALFISACDSRQSSDEIQQDQQENILKEGTSKVGMPGIVNFREKQMMKQIIERRDQNFTTYAYIFVPMVGKFVYLGECAGYGIPAATQYTSPQKYVYSANRGSAVLPQADPQGTFSPPSANATWVMMFDPKSKQADVQYLEDNVDMFTFKLPDRLVIQ